MFTLIFVIVEQKEGAIKILEEEESAFSRLYFPVLNTGPCIVVEQKTIYVIPSKVGVKKRLQKSFKFCVLVVFE